VRPIEANSPPAFQPPPFGGTRDDLTDDREHSKNSPDASFHHLEGLPDLPYLAIRASMRPDKRTEIMHQFNNEDHPTCILITTFKTCSLGTNLQKACHNMVILEPARNINTLLQAVGRLNRVEQTRMQEVTILSQEYTLNYRLEYIASKKVMAQIAGSRYGDSQEDLERTIVRMLG
jgi:SNF2 family DNA or RNA helicase